MKTHEMLEGENDRLMDEMAHKIDTLKTVSFVYLYYLSLVSFHCGLSILTTSVSGMV